MNCPHRPLTGDLSCNLPEGHEGLHRNYQGIMFRAGPELELEDTCGEPCPQYPVACTEVAGHAHPDHRHIGPSGRYEWPIAQGRHRADTSPATDNPEPTPEACAAAHPRFDARCDLIAGHAIPHRSKSAGITWTDEPQPARYRSPIESDLAYALFRAVETIKATAGAVEIAGVRIEPCDSRGQTDTTRELSDARERAGRYAEDANRLESDRDQLEAKLGEARERLDQLEGADQALIGLEGELAEVREQAAKWQTLAHSREVELAEVRRQRDYAEQTAERRGDYLDVLEGRVNRALAALEGRDEHDDDDELVNPPCNVVLSSAHIRARCERDAGHEPPHSDGGVTW